MQTPISKFIYYFISIMLIIIGLIVKFFLFDIDFTANLKASNILFSFAILLVVIGLSLNAIKRNKKSTLKDKTIILSAMLIIPFSLVFALTPMLETFYPNKSGEGVLSKIFSYSAIIGSFAAIIWIILIIVIIIGQISLIFFRKSQ